MNKNVNIKYEKCIICGSTTQEPIDRHISNRNNYIEGAGQLCNQCALSLQ